MTEGPADVRTVTVEREIGYPPEKVWRALTTPHLLQEWLMQNDFVAERGHVFQFSGDWGAVECRVVAVEPPVSLSYTWNAMGLESLVRWTLTPVGSGTRLRMEQTGFRKDQEQAYQGARFGWKRMIDTLEELLARAETAA